MAFTFYSLLEATLLCLNAVCILHEERFLAKSMTIDIIFNVLSTVPVTGTVFTEYTVLASARWPVRHSSKQNSLCEASCRLPVA